MPVSAIMVMLLALGEFVGIGAAAGAVMVNAAV
jgi:hypothetical protein